MRLALGIDTGRTYTDAEIINYEAGQVMSSGKALTTRPNLAIGIATAIHQVLGATSQTIPWFLAEQIALVAVSTTFACPRA